MDSDQSLKTSGYLGQELFEVHGVVEKVQERRKEIQEESVLEFQEVKICKSLTEWEIQVLPAVRSQIGPQLELLAASC